MNLDLHVIVLDDLQSRRTDIDGSLFHRAREGTYSSLGGSGLHILLNPGHGRTLRTVLSVKARVVNPCLTYDIAPQRDTGTVGLLPHHRQYLLVLSFLLGIVGNVNIQLRDEHRHLQCVLLTFQGVRQVCGAHASHRMRLVAVGINRCSGIAKGANEVEVIVYVILDRVVVVVNQNGIRPTLVGHVKCLNEPVVARFATAAQGLLHHGVTLLVHTHCLVHHVNHGQCLVMLLGMVEPVCECSKALIG